MARLRSRVGRVARELIVHAQRLSQPSRGRRRVVIFPSDWFSGSSGDLRGRALVPELRRLGWRAVCVPPHLGLAQRLRIVNAERPDVILFQSQRHPLNRPSYFAGIPCVYDADDADFFDPKFTEVVPECCRDSAAAIAGSRFVARAFRHHNANVTVVWTGSYVRPSAGATPSDRRDRVVAWATLDPVGYRHEAELVFRVIEQLADRTRFRFAVYGAREETRDQLEASLEPIRRKGVPVEVFSRMPYTKFVRSLESAAVGLHPVCLAAPFSRGKSFGKLLAYLIAGAAVVTSDAVDNPLFFHHGVNGMLVPEEVERWVDCCERLLADPAARKRIAERGQADFARRLTTARAAELVSRQLHRAVDIGRAR